MTSRALELLWGEFLGKPHTKEEITIIMRKVPELAEAAAFELLKHPEANKSDWRNILSCRESEPSGIQAARKLLDHPEVDEDDLRVVIHYLDDGPLRVRAAKALLSSVPSADSLAIIINTFKEDSKLWERAASQLANLPEATDGHLSTITGTADRRDVDVAPIYLAIVRHPNAEALTVGRIVLDCRGEVRMAALERFFAFKRERLDDRFYQVLERLGGDEKWLAKATRLILRFNPESRYLASIDRKLGAEANHEKFWRQFLGMKDLSWKALVLLADYIESPRSYTTLARRILRNPEANNNYFNNFERRLGPEAVERFWLREMEKSDFPIPVLGYLLTNAPTPRVREVAGQRYLEQEDTFWRRLSVYECVPELQKKLKPSIIKGIKELPSSDLPRVMKRIKEFEPLAWEELKRRPDPDPLMKVISEFPFYMPEAWVLFKACSNHSKYQLSWIGEQVPSLAGEVESILRSMDNSYLIEEMQSLSRRY